MSHNYSRGLRINARRPNTQPKQMVSVDLESFWNSIDSCQVEAALTVTEKASAIGKYGHSSTVILETESLSFDLEFVKNLQFLRAKNSLQDKALFK